MPGPRRPGKAQRLRQCWGHYPVLQAVLLAVFAIAAFWLLGNITGTMARIGITPGFDFLWRSTSFEIGESSIPFNASDPYIRAMLVGLINTLKVSIAGCVLATILGVAIGIAGLSGNLLLAKLVRVYVEVIRNTPLLLQLFFWISLAKAFPAPRQAEGLFGLAFLTNRGVFLPTLSIEGIALGTFPLLLLTGAVYLAVLFLLSRRRALTILRAVLAGVVVLALLHALLLALGASVSLDIPALSGFNIRGGYNLTPEFAALLTGLVVKFSAAIAEIVRAGIQSVTRGQWEAARALGLHNGQIMRLVVLPQAMRVITPMTTSSYLDLTKDSSLAVAIGYPDLVSIVNTTANTTGQSMEALIILIGTYLAINLSVSVLMNEYNRRVALRGSVR